MTLTMNAVEQHGKGERALFETLTTTRLAPNKLQFYRRLDGCHDRAEERPPMRARPSKMTTTSRQRFLERVNKLQFPRRLDGCHDRREERPPLRPRPSKMTTTSRRRFAERAPKVYAYHGARTNLISCRQHSQLFWQALRCQVSMSLQKRRGATQFLQSARQHKSSPAFSN